MALDVFEEMKRMQTDMNKMFERLLNGSDFVGFTSDGWREPVASMWEDGNGIFTKFELPGVKKSDITLSIKEDSIEVRADTDLEKLQVDEDYTGTERTYKGFYKVIALPTKVQPDTAAAVFDNGILEIQVRKSDSQANGAKVKIR